MKIKIKINKKIFLVKTVRKYKIFNHYIKFVVLKSMKVSF